MSRGDDMTEEHRKSLRRMRARAAAYAMHAQHDSRVTSRKGREAFLARFEREVDPEGVLPERERCRRAELAKRAHFTRLAIRSAEVRRARAAS